ncbi:MAG: acetyl-CoA carboxylase carboxyl transferase subunit beta, partial [Clostridia bacterium]|nr:acetyl-CoA carboxylase carboxyl transferase subunit beta [Clostridia bacterium]
MRDRMERDQNDASRPAPAREFEYRKPIPDDLWVRCPECGGVMARDDFGRAGHVCIKCGHHFRIGARQRIDSVVDSGTFSEWSEGIVGGNPLGYPGYPEKLDRLREETGLEEAVVCGGAAIGGEPCALAAMDSRFLMASMGTAVGERLTAMFERATEERLPVVVFSASGGARMQEGVLSLMQMAKTAAAVGRHGAAGLLYISVMTDPTTGGVTASFASLGDILLAEPEALIGFAGRRVIEGT